ncbi:MAG: hypothetical protein AB4426_20850 [Xenococcaceae cyanobacterium]
MDIFVYLVDWPEVLQHHRQGTLEEDMFAAIEAAEAIAQSQVNINWVEYVKQSIQTGVKNPLIQYYLAALEQGESWGRSYRGIYESHNIYCIVADAYEELRVGLPPEIQKLTDRFMNPLITFDGYCQDIDISQSECLAQAISEESVIKFADLAERIDFSSLSQAYYDHCSERIKESFADYYPGTKPELSFEEGFLLYIQDWLELLEIAKQKQQGILIQWA